MGSVADLLKPKSKEEIIEILKENFELDERVLKLIENNDEAYNSFLKATGNGATGNIEFINFLLKYFDLELKK